MMWSFYSLADGVFTGARQAGRRLVGTPQGCGAIEGAYDPRTHRVDVETGDVVAYQRSSAEIEAEQRVEQKRRARRRVEQLELTQRRPMRELAIDPSNAEAKRRLVAIDDEISALRKDLNS